MAKTNNNMECSEVEALNFPPTVQAVPHAPSGQNQQTSGWPLRSRYRIKTTDGILNFVCVSNTEDNISFKCETLVNGKTVFANMDHGEFIDQHAMGRIEEMGTDREQKKVLWTKSTCGHSRNGRLPVCPYCRCGMETTGKNEWICINEDCVECESFSYEWEK